MTLPPNPRKHHVDMSKRWLWDINERNARAKAMKRYYATRNACSLAGIETPPATLSSLDSAGIDQATARLEAMLATHRTDA